MIIPPATPPSLATGALATGPLTGGPLLATSTIELTLRMGVALLVIMGLLWLVTRFAKRQLGPRGNDRPHIDVTFQRQLTKHATLSLVKAGDRNLLVASNNQAITLLAEGDDLIAVPEAPARSSRVTRGVTGDQPSIDVRPKPVNPIRALQDRTVRRG
ncbi:MAG: flagellar biosynthetic protein FliO [Actinomycetota bacterium]